MEWSAWYLGTQVMAPAPSVKWELGDWLPTSMDAGVCGGGDGQRDPCAEVLGYGIGKHHVEDRPKVANGSFLSCRSLSTLI